MLPKELMVIQMIANLVRLKHDSVAYEAAKDKILINYPHLTRESLDKQIEEYK